MKKLITAILTLCISLSFAAPAMASYEGGYYADDEASYGEVPALPVATLIGDAPEMAPASCYFFSDCAEYPMVEEAAALGLVRGYGDDTFRPLGTVTRGEWYQMLLNAFGRTPHYDAYANKSADAGWMLDTLQLMLGHALFVSNYDWRQASISSASASSDDYVARYEAVQLLLLAIAPVSVEDPEPHHFG